MLHPAKAPTASRCSMIAALSAGAFTKAEDLLEVPGIGEKKLAAIREMLRFD